MERCTLRDDAESGCVKAAGHTGRCKVRPFTGRVEGAPARRKARRAPSKRPAGLGRELIALAAVMGRIETAVSGLLPEFQTYLTGMAGRLAASRKRVAKALSAMLQARRQVARMMSGEEGTDADADPNPDEET